MVTLVLRNEMQWLSFLQSRERPSFFPLAGSALKIPRLTTALMCCVFFTACETNVDSDGRSEVEVVELLESIGTWSRSSLGNPNDPVPALLTVREDRPVAELTALYRGRHPAVMDLGGVFFGVVCRYVDREHFLGVFESDLGDPDPALRHFACLALGELGQKEAVPLLKPLLDDDAVVPGHLDRRVSLSAALALAWLGSPDGFPVMFEWAERNPNAWDRVCLRHFHRFSDIDFGADLEAWRRHFAVNAPVAPVSESYRWSRMVGEGPGITAYEFGSD